MMTKQETLQIAKQIALSVAQKGGQAYFVGGYVRDRLLNIDTKDIDIEVHGIAPRELEAILDSVGQRIEIGKSFGVYNLKGCSLDIAMPRKERAIGHGHRDFEVEVDPFIGTEKAAKRRDFTVNAMMEHVLTGEVTDHYGGQNDLQKGILRHVNDDAFPEDPLRVLRGAQFAARFRFTIAEETVKLCSSIELRTLSKERVFEELRKALLKAEKPSLFFENLKRMQQLSPWFLEVQQLIGVPQREKYHREGDVWTHTMMVLDEAAKRRDRVQNPIGLMLAALCHDFGKAVCTKVIDGEIRAFGHETEGLSLIDTFLRRITNETACIAYVKNLAELHMRPNTLAACNASVKATNKLFDKATEPRALIQLALADGRGKISDSPFFDTEPFLMERLQIFEEIMARPYVMGRDLIDAGFTPNETFSKLLAYAHKLRLSGVEKDTALKQTLAYAKEITKNKKF